MRGRNVVSNKYTIVIVGCNEYHDIADLNAFFLNRYWTESGEKIYATETMLPNNPIFDKEVAVGKDSVWSDRILKVIEEINTPYVIVLCDDYFISGNVKNSSIEKYINVCEKNGLGCLKLMPAADKYELIDERFGLCKSGVYRLSSMPAIWKKDYLRKICELHVNVWNFELKGSEYSLELPDPVWCTRKNVIPFVHALNQGKWEYDAVRLFKREGIEKGVYGHRKNKSVFKYLYRAIGGAVYRKFPKLFKKIRKAAYKVIPNPHNV